MQLIIKTILIFLFLVSISSANEIFISLKKNKVNVRYGPSFDSDVKYQSEPMAFSRPAEKKLSKHKQSVNKAIDFFSSFKIFYAKK